MVVPPPYSKHSKRGSVAPSLAPTYATIDPVHAVSPPPSYALPSEAPGVHGSQRGGQGDIQGVPPPTYTFAMRDAAHYPTIPSELGREIQGN